MSGPPLTISQHTRVLESLYLIDPIGKRVLKRFARHVRLELDDLRSVGKLALYNAVVRFKSHLGEWEPYASVRVEGDMINSVKRESGEGRIQQAAIAALAHHLAHRGDKFNILHDTLPDMEAVLNKISLAALVVQFAAGLEQAQREAIDHANEVEEYVAAVEQLRKAKATLPPDLQELVRLAFHERLYQEDIAGQLGIATRTVARRIDRALVLLREYLVAHGVTQAPVPVRLEIVTDVDAIEPIANDATSPPEGRCT